MWFQHISCKFTCWNNYLVVNSLCMHLAAFSQVSRPRVKHYPLKFWIGRSTAVEEIMCLFLMLLFTCLTIFFHLSNIKWWRKNFFWKTIFNHGPQDNSKHISQHLLKVKMQLMPHGVILCWHLKEGCRYWVKRWESMRRKVGEYTG